jgi:hypothetical protein
MHIAPQTELKVEVEPVCSARQKFDLKEIEDVIQRAELFEDSRRKGRYLMSLSAVFWSIR